MGKNITKTITVDSDLLDWVDEQIRNKRFHNLTHAVNLGLQKLKESQG